MVIVFKPKDGSLDKLSTARTTGLLADLSRFENEGGRIIPPAKFHSINLINPTPWKN